MLWSLLRRLLNATSIEVRYLAAKQASVSSSFTVSVPVPAQSLTRNPPPPVGYPKRLLEALDLVQPGRLIQDIVAVRHEQHAGVVERERPRRRVSCWVRCCEGAVGGLRRLVERVDHRVDRVDVFRVDLLGFDHPGEEVRLVRFHQRSARISQF